jgi:leucine-rich repeat-containing G protein-coupled receptor 8
MWCLFSDVELERLRYVLTLYVLTSTCVLYFAAVITLDRFLVIIFPFRVRRLEMPKTRLLMALGWLGAAILSGLPLLHIDYFQ